MMPFMLGIKEMRSMMFNKDQNHVSITANKIGYWWNNLGEWRSFFLIQLISPGQPSLFQVLLPRARKYT
jgi:hypothetical protein